MKCPFCGKDNTRVVDSRPVGDNTAIRRRRLCDSCGKRFTSFEKVEMLPLMVIKKDNSRAPFDRNKIESCILRACHKRPVSMEQVRAIVDEVENEVLGSGEREVPSSAIGESVMRHLKKLDEVGYVRFASVYREFKDVDSFLKELRMLQETQGDTKAPR